MINNKILFKGFTLVISTFLALNLFAKNGKLKVKEDIVIHKIGFEDASDYQNWKSKKGKLIPNALHFKEGKTSLEWQYKKGDILEIDQLEGLNKAALPYKGGSPEIYEASYFKEGKYGGIKMWVYQEEAQSGKMIFQIGSDLANAKKNPKYKFEVSLGFTGWRAIWVQFEQDASVPNYSGAEEIHSIVAIPEGVQKPSKFYFDHFQLLEFISEKRNSDMQIQNKKAGNRVDSYVILPAYLEYRKLFEQELEGQNIGDLKAHSEKIMNKLETLILGNKSNQWKKRLPELKKRLNSNIKGAYEFYDELGIKREGNHINGLPVFASRDEHGLTESYTFQYVGQKTIYPLAMDYKINKKEEAKEKLFAVLDHLEDQGWAAGSAIGTADHIIRLNSYASGIFLMRNELQQQDKLKSRQEMLAWHTRLGSLINLQTSKGENTDLIRGGALPKLVAILLMEDGAEKQLMLQKYKEYLEYAMQFAPGYSDTIKPDFSIFHHRGTYLSAYGVSTLNTLSMLKWLLDGTPYAISPNSVNTLKKALKRQAEIAYGVDIHQGASGRFPYNNHAIDRFILPAYMFVSTNGEEVEDEEMANLFHYLYKISPRKGIYSVLFPSLTYAGTFGTVDLMENLSAKTSEGYTIENQHISMPYSSMNVHRYDGAYAAVKGYGRYVWDFETGSKGENNLGRYLSHGMLLVAQGDSEKGLKGVGIDFNAGFDWSMLPGATTKMLPKEEVLYYNTPTEKYLEGFHRSFTSSKFASGLNTKDQLGIYAVDLRDEVTPAPKQVLFDATFSAKKSYFFFENEIICLGSSIKNKDNTYNTVTTLFQYINDEKAGQPISFNGEEVNTSASNVKKTATAGVLKDQQGIYYVVPEGNNIILQNDTQESYKMKKGKYSPISALATKAWIDHGKQPKSEGYEYKIVTKRATADANELKGGYQVIQKDDKAHIVHHTKTNATAYAIFDANNTVDKGVVYTTDTPILCMFKEGKSSSLLTVANPDLNLVTWNHNMSKMPAEIVHASNAGMIVTMQLNGNWKQAGYSAELISLTIKEDKTEVVFFTKDGKSIDLPLEKIETANNLLN
ncbi:chondroitinase family polysaccharide lyase [Flammeovirga aprica]|uniref:Lyase n=1 Tax=Flammeovirga aprica JL-4 TaxID=694437 RepID=A0A7X9RT33_9BACT|nr:chondroitinase family polysaccharide lyase [Flammeovirga aprica]NME66784.1 lyase [Flammeovirga aprica JL-4]